MKKNLFKALESANSELSKKGQVKIDSNLMNHISGGRSSGMICTLSGECRPDGRSCNPFIVISPKQEEMVED